MFNRDMEDKVDYFYGRDATVVALDCNSTMDLNYISQCLVGLFQQRMFDSGSYVSVVLYNLMRSSECRDGVRCWHPMEPPSPALLLRLAEIGCSEFKTEVGLGKRNTPTESNLSSLFSVCIQLLNKDLRCDTKRLIILTNIEDPFHQEPQTKVQILQRLEDLKDSSILFLPCFFTVKSLFWDQICSKLECFSEPVSMEELQTLLLRQTPKKRTSFNLKFYLTEHMFLFVLGYSIVAKTNPPSYVYVDTETEIQVERQTVLFSEGVEVEPENVMFETNFGSEKLLFNPDERKKLSSFGPSEIRLLNFVEGELPRHLHLKHSIFMVSDKEDLDSTKKMHLLVDQMIKLNRFGVARCVFRANSNPRMCALIPQLEEFDKYGMKIPTGIHLIQLPYLDDIRPDVEPCLEETSLSDTMKKIIFGFQTSKFDPSCFPDPKLNHVYQMLHAKALNEESELKDLKMMDPDKNVWNILSSSAAKELLKKVGEVYPISIRGAQRQKMQAFNPNDPEVQMDCEKVIDAHSKNKLESLKVSVLANFLRARGVQAATRLKKDVIEQIKNVLN